MDKSKKILVYIGIGLLATIGVYVGIKAKSKEKELSDLSNKNN